MLPQLESPSAEESLVPYCLALLVPVLEAPSLFQLLESPSAEESQWYVSGI